MVSWEPPFLLNRYFGADLRAMMLSLLGPEGYRTLAQTLESATET
jgi:hypothetical protein